MRQKGVVGAGHCGDHSKFLCATDAGKRQEGRQITLNNIFKQTQGAILYFHHETGVHTTRQNALFKGYDSTIVLKRRMICSG